MSDDASGFGKFVPGFDFLQSLAKGAAQSMPQMPSLGNWVAPTISVDELDKRIAELKAVQFWLDQNAMALKATIQALEVQKMTLATLQNMNVSMSEVAKAFTPKVTPGAPQPAGAAPAPARPVAKEPEPPAPSPRVGTEAEAGNDTEAQAESKPAAALVDPMQWWGALTQQFQQIASAAIKEATARPAPSAADSAKAKRPAAAPVPATKVAAKRAPAKKVAARKRAG